MKMSEMLSIIFPHRVNVPSIEELSAEDVVYNAIDVILSNQMNAENALAAEKQRAEIAENALAAEKALLKSADENFELTKQDIDNEEKKEYDKWVPIKNFEPDEARVFDARNEYEAAMIYLATKRLALEQRIMRRAYVLSRDADVSLAKVLAKNAELEATLASVRKLLSL